ncbi:MAG: MaoC family dehydratase [Actinobacteria bacterium]|nr:MaoC family dehydratase [Actinomycetota bacterium]MCB9390539.1 MaoC family dehydratase [Acidimicrobiia bacterium]
MSARVFENLDQIREAVGVPLGSTDWLEMTQERIDQFADATGDHQWIHVDPERAKEGPFGTTIAHGYLTLSLASLFLPQLLRVEGISMGINYGCNKVRFPNPVRVGSRIRGTGEIVEVSDTSGGFQMVARVVIEIDGESKPACVADTVSRYLF